MEKFFLAILFKIFFTLPWMMVKHLKLKKCCFLRSRFLRYGKRVKKLYYHKKWYGNDFLKLFFVTKKVI